jgi:hypothetical protein
LDAENGNHDLSNWCVCLGVFDSCGDLEGFKAMKTKLAILICLVNLCLVARSQTYKVNNLFGTTISITTGSASNYLSFPVGTTEIRNPNVQGLLVTSFGLPSSLPLTNDYELTIAPGSTHSPIWYGAYVPAPMLFVGVIWSAFAAGLQLGAVVVAGAIGFTLLRTIFHETEDI